MKKSLSISLVAALATVLVIPQTGLALTQSEIDRELANIKKLEAQAAKNRANAEAEKKRITVQKAQEAQSIKDLMQQINEQGQKLVQLTGQIDDTTIELNAAGQELEEAQKRVESRDEMLRTRIRLMYTNGVVSYLDVLFSATSFTDFLDRYQALKMIVSQDKTILEANQKDRDVIEDRKQEIQSQLEEIKVLYAQAEDARERLVQQEKEKEKAVMILSQREKAVEDISEQQEALLKELARKKDKLYAQRQPAAYSGGQFAWPVPSSSRITSHFGERSERSAPHKGMDIGAPQGTTIVAAADGVVIVAQWTNGYGNTVIINHGGGLWSLYGHIRNGGIVVKEGANVKRGQKIAEVGSTGQSTGPHLHFEVRKNEVVVSPNPYLGK